MLPNQADLFRSQAVYQWPANGPGALTHQTGGRWWRARSAPVLSASWVSVPAEAELDERMQLYWLHPSPLTRADNELRRLVAASINVETCRWWVSWVGMVGRENRPWSRGQSTDIESAKVDCLARIMRVAGYHLQRSALEAADAA